MPCLTSRFRAGVSRRGMLYRGALVLCSAAMPPITLRAQAVGPVMDALSRYMAGAKDRGLPPEAVEHTKHHILDTFAAMVSGSELPPGRAALALARAQHLVAPVLGLTTA